MKILEDQHFQKYSNQPKKSMVKVSEITFSPILYLQDTLIEYMYCILYVCNFYFIEKFLCIFFIFI